MTNSYLTISKLILATKHFNGLKTIKCNMYDLNYYKSCAKLIMAE